VFGGVLLTSEKTEDFEWAFSNFVNIMGGKESCMILTGNPGLRCKRRYRAMHLMLIAESVDM
jgi:hypothetical protein